MGLSASQARLLNLTARMHDIEYKAQNLEAQKLQMANESTHVYQEYEDALNRQKVQFKHLAADGSATYRDAGLKDLFNANYKVKLLNNSTWIDFGGYDRDLNNLYQFNTVPEATAPTGGTVPSSLISGVTMCKDGSGIIYKVTGDGVNPNKFYKETAASQSITSAELKSLDVTDTEVLRNLVEAGFIVFEKPEYENGVLTGYTETNIATDTNLQEVTDEVDLKKAEAKYEADMRKIDYKDKKFDTDLAALETERNAIKQEMETLKTVAKDNVDRTFKLFS